MPNLRLILGCSIFQGALQSLVPALAAPTALPSNAEAEREAISARFGDFWARALETDSWARRALLAAIEDESHGDDGRA